LKKHLAAQHAKKIVDCSGDIDMTNVNDYFLCAPDVELELGDKDVLPEALTVTEEYDDYDTPEDPMGKYMQNDDEAMWAAFCKLNPTLQQRFDTEYANLI
jgi:hypothetical protein